MVGPERQAWLEAGNIAHADTKPRTGPEHLGTPSGQPGIPAPEHSLTGRTPRNTLNFND